MPPQPNAPDPQLFRWLHGLALQLYQAEAYAYAADIYRFLVLEQHRDPAAWFLLARCHQELGQEDTALRLFQLAAASGQHDLFGRLVAARHRDSLPARSNQ